MKSAGEEIKLDGKGFWWKIFHASLKLALLPLGGWVGG